MAIREMIIEDNELFNTIWNKQYGRIPGMHGNLNAHDQLVIRNKDKTRALLTEVSTVKWTFAHDNDYITVDVKCRKHPEEYEMMLNNVEFEKHWKYRNNGHETVYLKGSWNFSKLDTVLVKDSNSDRVLRTVATFFRADVDSSSEGMLCLYAYNHMAYLSVIPEA